MKGFSRIIESICEYSERDFNTIKPWTFATITVEPVPTLLMAPTELLTKSFLQVVKDRHKYHQKRIEREGRG